MTVQARDLPNQLMPLLGVALGDALGAGVEGGRQLQRALEEEPDDIGRRFFPYSPFGFAAGEVTDDTQMAWACAAGLSAAPLPDLATADGRAEFLHTVSRAYEDWFEAHPPDVGGQTAIALSRVQEVENSTPQRRIATRSGGWLAWKGGDAAGNGSLMRATGTFSAGYRGEALMAAGALDSIITHADPRCVAACVWYVRALDLLLADEGDGFAEHARAAVADMRSFEIEPVVRPTAPAELWKTFSDRWPRTVQTIEDTVERALAGGHVDCTIEPWQRWPSGYVIDGLGQATWAADSATDAADGLRRAVLHGGRDADSIGAIAGGLIGARFARTAADSWPAQLLSQLRLGHSWRDSDARPFLELLTQLA